MVPEFIWLFLQGFPKLFSFIHKTAILLPKSCDILDRRDAPNFYDFKGKSNGQPRCSCYRVSEQVVLKWLKCQRKLNCSESEVLIKLIQLLLMKSWALPEIHSISENRIILYVTHNCNTLQYLFKISLLNKVFVTILISAASNFFLWVRGHIRPRLRDWYKASLKVCFISFHALQFHVWINSLTKVMGELPFIINKSILCLILCSGMWQIKAVSHRQLEDIWWVLFFILNELKVSCTLC